MHRTIRWAVPLVLATVIAVVATIVVLTPGSTEVVAPRIAGDTQVAPLLVAGDWPQPAPPPAPPSAPPSAPPPAPPPAPTHPASFTVADAKGSTVELFSAPDVPLGESLDNPTWEGLAVVFHVLADRGEWLQVRVSKRPNGLVAWVKAAEVALREVPNWIQVEIGAKRMTVFHADTALVSTTVAVGKDATPTPIGSFFVDGIVPLDPPHRAYGAGQVSVSGFSPTLDSFGGGVGQIALHGTFATELLGQETSNGCVRLDNDSIRQVMDLAPTGTPVEIVA
ncbi:hypothetical protein BH24ACT4_BH24ACT4_18530 [soil metagenome]